MKIGVPKVKFEGFIVSNAHANWIATRKVYGDGNVLIPLEGRERTCIFHWSANLDKKTQKHIWPPIQHQHMQFIKDYRDAKHMEEVNIKYQVIHSWWLLFGATTEDGMYILAKWFGS